MSITALLLVGTVGYLIGEHNGNRSRMTFRKPEYSPFEKIRQTATDIYCKKLYQKAFGEDYIKSYSYYIPGYGYRPNGAYPSYNRIENENEETEEASDS